MAALTAKLFRDYFGGSWACKVTKNGDFQREIIFNWPQAFGKYSSLGTGEGLVVPDGFRRSGRHQPDCHSRLAQRSSKMVLYLA